MWYRIQNLPEPHRIIITTAAIKQKVIALSFVFVSFFFHAHVWYYIYPVSNGFITRRNRNHFTSRTKQKRTKRNDVAVHREGGHWTRLPFLLTIQVSPSCPPVFFFIILSLLLLLRLNIVG